MRHRKLNLGPILLWMGIGLTVITTGKFLKHHRNLTRPVSWKETSPKTGSLQNQDKAEEVRKKRLAQDTAELTKVLGKKEDLHKLFGDPKEAGRVFGVLSSVSNYVTQFGKGDLSLELLQNLETEL